MAPRMYAVCHQPAKHWTGVRGPPLPSKEGNAKYAVTCRSAAAASARMCYSALLCCAVLCCAVLYTTMYGVINGYARFCLSLVTRVAWGTC
jgi:hypothetical protein